MRTALCETLGFLSDDEYEFNFKKLRREQPAARYLDFSHDPDAGFQAEEVMLFSGGLDSLGGAVHEVLDEKRSVALVSHRSSPKIDAKQQQLKRDFAARSSRKPLHVPVWVNKEKALGRGIHAAQPFLPVRGTGRRGGAALQPVASPRLRKRRGQHQSADLGAGR